MELQSKGTPIHAVVVGFDTRFLSDRYATDVARVLAANGYTVHLSQADAPTPAISYMVRHLEAIAGVMITASHNAPRYNGVKLKAAYGGSALSEQCRQVEVYLNDNEVRARGPNLMDYEQARKLGLIQRFNPLPAYYDHLRRLIDFDTIAENPQRVVVELDVRIRPRCYQRHPARYRLRSTGNSGRNKSRVWRRSPRADC